MLPRLATVALTLALVSTSQLVVAQTDFETRGHIHLSFESDKILEHRNVHAFEPFDVYVLVDFEDVSTGTSISFAQAGLRFDESIAFSSIELIQDGIVILHDLEDGFVQLSPTFHGCAGFSTDLTPIVRLRAIVQDSTPRALIGIEAVTNDPTFGGQGPGWSTCDGRTLYLFGSEGASWPKLTLSVPVSTGTGTWSVVKSTYGRKERP
jgi:hypothetical protein